MKRVSTAILILSFAYLFYFLVGQDEQLLISEKKIELSKVVQSRLLQDSRGSIKGESSVDDFSPKLQELPTFSEIQNLSNEDVHHTPDLVKRAGVVIGEVHQSAQVRPVLRPSALKFFTQCAEDDETIHSIRALCLKKVISLIAEWKLSSPISLSKIPPRVFALASKI
ncbi:hypothetical protein BIY24_03955 [Halobacteriovorax marinus]|uniref:hypothetical protein n=1 Tax=Halobacteriovorax marinus TaxID=97084 RepID=UPI000BC31748|nr:hypothetical protein [Halobacteriovorax marinus]ATH07120.1 hypothetical protein BIY24_03955 [Halobacteriovorax marinus]